MGDSRSDGSHESPDDAGPREFPLELRERAVRMYRAAVPKPVFRRLAEDLGVHHGALHNWIRQAEAAASEREDLLTSGETGRTRPAAGCGNYAGRTRPCGRQSVDRDGPPYAGRMEVRCPRRSTA
ncbi:transposase [Streptomyces sp. NBC_00287]|uniref:transposase n=1 Tax=Streptomyces sp. NBC_00287 TaxID=2975702 RepID=UPI003FA7AACB